MNSIHQPYNGYEFGSHCLLKVEDDVFSPISRSDFQIVSLSTKNYEAGRLFQEQEHIGCSFLFVDQYEVFIHNIQDPFVVWLESRSIPSWSNTINNKLMVQFVHKQVLSRFYLMFLDKSMQGSKSVNTALAWLHWVFYFT